MKKLLWLLFASCAIPASAQSPNPNCAFGVLAPSGTVCGIGDLSAANPIAGTDTISVCQQAGGCIYSPTATNSYHKATQTQISTYLRTQLSAASPITYNPSTGQISCPTCGTSTGATISLAPGLTSVPGTYNNGSGAASTVTGGQIISPQLFYDSHSSAYTVAPTDAGKLLTATGAGPVTFTLPTPIGGVGGPSYAFGYDGSHAYNLTTPAGNIYGCGATAATVSVGAAASVTSDGSNWQCAAPVAPTGGPTTSGANTWTGSNFFNGAQLYSSVNTQSGAAYTLTINDCGHTVAFTSASAVTLTTLNALPAGCAIAIVQAGAGQVTVTPTPASVNSFSKTKAQWAIIGLTVDSNAGGTSAHFILSGDGA